MAKRKDIYGWEAFVEGAKPKLGDFIHMVFFPLTILTSPLIGVFFAIFGTTIDVEANPSTTNRAS